jgi:hypothetical protein
MDKPKKLILDYSKWRCGDFGKHSVGFGFTQLLNNEGYMCCLGQIGRQCGMLDSELIGRGIPSKVYRSSIPIFSRNSAFIGQALLINDDPDTSPEEKISALTQLLAAEGIELEVINKP